MTQEEKQLLLNDLCARLPYGVKCSAVLDDGTYGGLFRLSDELNRKHLMFSDIPYAVRPYLRPMSSMTDEEYKEFCKISGLFKKEEGNYFSNHLSEWGNSIITEKVMVKTIDWFNAHHFDYRGLIPMGLALEAPEGMYKEK